MREGSFENARKYIPVGSDGDIPVADGFERPFPQPLPQTAPSVSVNKENVPFFFDIMWSCKPA